MKARNPSTGNLESIYVKALDSLPVGSQIEFSGTDIPAGWEEVNDYSTTEVNTGKKWIDGKDIYRKVVEIETLPNATAGNYAHGISNIDDIVDIKGRYRISGQSQWYPIIYLNSGANFNNSVGISIDGTNISIYAGASDRRTWTAKIILEYTKSS